MLGVSLAGFEIAASEQRGLVPRVADGPVDEVGLEQPANAAAAASPTTSKPAIGERVRNVACMLNWLGAPRSDE